MAIIKIEVPIAGKGKERNWMLHDRSHERYQFLPDRCVPETLRRAMNGDHKGYFVAVWQGDAGWRVGARVADQEW
jgi:hypothetical protein